MGRRVRRLWLLPIVALIAAGCGSDDDGSSDAETTTAAPAATSAAATTAASPTSSDGSSDGSSADVSAAPAADGEPIKLMSIYVKNNPAFSQPQTFAGAQARVEAINADGGINGHPIELIECDSNLDPNQEKACIDQAIAEQVSAVVSSSIFFTPLTSLEEAGIPFIGAQGITPDQLSNPISYPFSGVQGWFQGQVAIAVAAGAESVTIVTGDTASSQYSESIAAAAAQAAGLTLNQSVVAAIGKADYTAEAAAAIADDPDAVLMNGPAEVLTKFTLAMRQAGYTGLIVSFGSGIGGDAIESLGESGEGVKVSLIARPISDTSDSTVAQFIAEMEATDSSAAQDELAEYGWSSVYLFAEVMQDAAAYDAAATIAAFDLVDSPISGGLFGPFQGTGTAVSPDTPRLFALSYIEGEVKDGVLVANGDFQDPADQLAGG